MHILIFGAGEIGTALGKVLEKKHDISLWDKDSSKMPEKINLGDAVAQADVIIIAVPAFANREAARTIMKYKSSDKPKLVLTVSKGLEPDTNKLMSDVLKEELNPRQSASRSALIHVSYGLLMGPMIAGDLMKNKSTKAIVALSNNDDKKLVDEVFAGTNINIDSSDDMRGVALCSVLKNIYALGIGMAAGRGEDKEKLNALRQNSLQEMRQVVTTAGGAAKTVDSPAGKDDFYITSSSPSSANFAVGQAIGRGMKPQKMSEGLSSIDGICQILGNNLSKFPILDKIKNDVSEKEPPMKTIKFLNSWTFRIIIALIVIVIILLIIFWPRKTTTETFTCSTDTKFVNCMPQIGNTDAERQAAQRQAEYCQFIQKNCPNVQAVF